MAATPRGRGGRGAAFPGQSVYEQSETAVHRIGERLVEDDRVFRYASAGAAIINGQICESAALGGATTTAQVDLTPSAVVVGASSVSITGDTTEQAANLFKDGWLTIVSDTIAHGAGQTYRIKDHDTIGAAAAETINLYDEVVFAVTTDCRVSLHTNSYRAVKNTAATTAVGTPVGASLIAVTSGYYFWLQTWGPAALLTGSTVIIDSALIRGLEAGESDIQAAAGITPEIGYAMEDGADGDYPLSFLMMAP